MHSAKFGVHEISDVRELLAFKTTCLSLDKERVEKVQNPELRLLIEQSMDHGKKSVIGMKDLLSSAKKTLH
ncbi:hypothetical protein HNQ94_001139 [Salirhabdus euzebyi]|uniref:Spore coat protein n=1 Tax=Salirhabdus euzebyi TaxID=394506 RepID=A0A841Q262_9BACI|nr:hypothetical protein [Salirhabdus euzebyi]MBB6452693.1 hypothetical protein [Salirhabdus euzebyi]